jgi:membrane-associated protein
LDLLAAFLDLVLHLDKHLVAMVQQYGAWIYAILFAVIFSETGFVVTPFLPGDSLLFVAGAVAASGGMDVNLLVFLLVAAAILGNSVNYGIGRWLGRHFFTNRGSRWLNPARATSGPWSTSSSSTAITTIRPTAATAQSS